MLAFGLPGKIELIIFGVSALIFAAGLFACFIALKHGLKKSNKRSTHTD